MASLTDAFGNVPDAANYYLELTNAPDTPEILKIGKGKMKEVNFLLSFTSND